MTPTTNPAETYEQYMVPPHFAPWADVLIHAATPHPGERLLDVACGTGIVARRVATRLEPDGHVVGLDLNPAMLAVARAAAEREGHAIEWLEGRAEALPFPDGTFNVATCQFALMFFVDREAAVAELRRVLTDNGRAALSVFQRLDRHPFYQTLHDVIHQRFGMSGVSDIFALGDIDNLHALLTGAGFRQVEIEPVSMTTRFPNPEAFLAGEIDVDTAAIPAMQHLDATTRSEMTAAIGGEMAEALAEVTEGDSVVIPFHAYVVLAKG